MRTEKPAQRTDEHIPEHEILDRILAEVKAFARRYGLHLILAVGVVVLGVTLLRIYAARRQERTAGAWRAVTDLQDTSYLWFRSPEVDQRLQVDIERARDLIANQPRTAGTPWLMLKLGNLQASAEQWEAAAATYGTLLESCADSGAAEMARVARACALEQLEQFADAGRLYERLAEGGLDLYFLDAGRCQELTGDAEAAGRSYRAFLGSGDVPDPLRRLAEARLTDLATGRLLSPVPELKPVVPAVPSGPVLAPAPDETQPDAHVPPPEPDTEE